jgi:hypothetical protein
MLKLRKPLGDSEIGQAYYVRVSWNLEGRQRPLGVAAELEFGVYVAKHGFSHEDEDLRGKVDSGKCNLKANLGFCGLRKGPTGTHGPLILDQMQLGLQAEATGDILVRNRETRACSH